MLAATCGWEHLYAHFAAVPMTVQGSGQAAQLPAAGEEEGDAVQKSQPALECPPGGAGGRLGRDEVLSACSALQFALSEGLCWPEQAGEGRFFLIVSARWHQMPHLNLQDRISTQLTAENCLGWVLLTHPENSPL